MRDGLGGSGFGDEFFELAFDVVAGAEHLGGEDAVGVDGEVVGDGVDAEEVAETVAGVAELDPVHVVFGDEVFPFGFVGVPTDADDDEGLTSELFGDLLDVGELFVAGAAPGGPEVDEDDAAAHGVQAKFCSVEGYYGEGGGHLVGGELGVCGEVLGAEVAGVVGGDAAEALLELLGCGVVLVETSENIAFEVVGGAVFGIVGYGGFERGVGGLIEIGLIFLECLEVEGLCAIGFGG